MAGGKRRTINLATNRACTVLVPVVEDGAAEDVGPLPGLFLFHGQFDHPDFWTKHGELDAALNRLPPAIVVIPQCVREILGNRHVQEEPKLKEFLTDLEDIKGALPVKGLILDPTRQAVLGISMGGKQAIPFAFNDPGITSIGLLSAMLQGNHLDDALRLCKIDLKERARSFDVFYHYCGSDGRDKEKFLEPNQALHEKLFEVKDVRTNKEGQPGNHNWLAWRRELAGFLGLVGERWTAGA